MPEIIVNFACGHCCHEGTDAAHGKIEQSSSHNQKMRFVFTTPPECSRTTMISTSYSCCQGDSKCGVKCEYDDANSRESSRTYHPSAAPSPCNQENHNHHNHRREGYTSPQVVGQHPSPEFVLNEQIKHEYQESLRSDLSEMGSENREFSVQSNPTESGVNSHAFDDPSLFERYDTFRLKKDYVEGLEEDRELPIPDAPRLPFIDLPESPVGDSHLLLAPLVRSIDLPEEDTPYLGSRTSDHSFPHYDYNHRSYIEQLRPREDMRRRVSIYRPAANTH
ncbi:hypothetical protein PNOK_0808400 [Pyrrhoderma noxium]|uniref:Uncharacterized protein n=1 Tax=Pyrrhoderma noxium TaxID=2282107 RepID=A0A286UAC7_9AGAM|nr:hypothetical protein PNOK_0808400 [Pyrrhoderma noxium]